MSKGKALGREILSKHKRISDPCSAHRRADLEVSCVLKL